MRAYEAGAEPRKQESRSYPHAQQRGFEGLEPVDYPGWPEIVYGALACEGILMGGILIDGGAAGANTQHVRPIACGFRGLPCDHQHSLLLTLLLRMAPACMFVIHYLRHWRH